MFRFQNNNTQSRNDTPPPPPNSTLKPTKITEGVTRGESGPKQ